MSSSNNVNIKMPRRYTSLLRGVIMASIVSSIMSFSLVSFKVYLQCSGSIECFEATFFVIWPRSFSVAFALAIPITLIVAPFVMRITAKMI